MEGNEIADLTAKNTLKLKDEEIMKAHLVNVRLNRQLKQK